jgi:osmotically-inducible protein OsmY
MKTDFLASNDNDLLNDVLLQLESDPRISSRDIAIAVKRGVVTLAGFVSSYDEKFLAEDTVKGIYGVRAVADEREVQEAARRTDPEIARDAVQTLGKQVDVPGDEIVLPVEDAWVRLQGSVEWEFQKQIAGTAVKNLKDVEGTIVADVCGSSRTIGLDAWSQIFGKLKQIIWSAFPREGRVHEGYE